MIDWQDIKWFHEVVVHGSFSAAARAAGTTQATISRRIRALEQRLGVDLFHRGHAGSELTPAGQRLAAPARKMNAAFERFAHEHRELTEETRTITITCGALIGLFLSKHLARVQQGVPQVDIEVKTTSDFLDLDRGEADIALRNRRPEKGQLTAKRLRAREYGPFSVFGSADHYRTGQLTFEELQGEPWAGYGARLRDLPTARWVREQIGDDRLKYRLNSAALMLEAVTTNRALALLPRFIGLETPGLVEVYGPVEGLAFEMWIVRRRSSDGDVVLRTVMRNVESLFR